MNNYDLSIRHNSVTKCHTTQTLRANRVNYYAHTAEDEQGKCLPEEHWQPLATHLRNVADLAKCFAAPIGLNDEAELAGLLHELMTFDLKTTKLASHVS